MEKDKNILHLRLPKGMVFTENQLMQFGQENGKKVETFMDYDFFTLIIHTMGNFGKAALFTNEVLTELNIWNREKKLGLIYPETFMYQVREHTYREADTSFVAFKKVPKEEQMIWLEESAKNSATLLLEIGSTSINSTIDLAKTIEYWIPFGTNYVIVVDLEIKKWYFFNNSINYSTHSFSEKFVAPSDLPDLVLDFEEIAKKCGF